MLLCTCRWRLESLANPLSTDNTTKQRDAIQMTNPFGTSWPVSGYFNMRLKITTDSVRYSSWCKNFVYLVKFIHFVTFFPISKKTWSAVSNAHQMILPCKSQVHAKPIFFGSKWKIKGAVSIASCFWKFHKILLNGLKGSAD